MNSYVPDYYGFNSFYPRATVGGYGYGYDNLCNRYANGVIYQVDCVTGMVEDVIPLYAGGYGVGQLLPSSYGYYNVPYQYRSMYYDTPDYGYWYAPGAIYQYDPGTQPDHLGRGAAVAGLLGRPAAAAGLRHLQRALCLSRDLL